MRDFRSEHVTGDLRAPVLIIFHRLVERNFGFSRYYVATDLTTFNCRVDTPIVGVGNAAAKGSTNVE
jgi:hypothetical protein